MTLVVVTHNPDLAAYMSRRVTLAEGQLTEVRNEK
jgi:predicted ABC-type transport system involved in lysophospholipase L1 biosynthesis ATPase subunit